MMFGMILLAGMLQKDRINEDFLALLLILAFVEIIMEVMIAGVVLTV